jgi:hypothetical protein
MDEETAGVSAEQMEIDAIRARAAKCRNFAQIYATEVGSSLVDLAVELDKKADRLDAKRAIVTPERPDDGAG